MAVCVDARAEVLAADGLGVEERHVEGVLVGSLVESMSAQASGRGLKRSQVRSMRFWICW